MRTDDLIERLSSNPGVAVPLPRPALRLAFWLVPSLAFMALVVASQSLRPDIAQAVASPRWLGEQALALATALAAALAALMLALPGRSRRWALLPVAPGAAWLATLGMGCLRDLQMLGRGGLSLTPDLECFVYISLIASVPTVILLAQLRRGATLAPGLAGALAVLAAAALGGFGLRLFHAQDLGLMVLVWQVGSVLALTLLGALAGPRLLGWPPRRGRAA